MQFPGLCAVAVALSLSTHLSPEFCSLSTAYRSCCVRVEHALKTPKKTQHPKVCADEFSKVLEVMDSTVKQQQADEETTDDAAAHSGDAGGGIDAADVVLDENADEDEMQEHDGDAADEKVEVLWGGRLETINVRLRQRNEL